MQPLEYLQLQLRLEGLEVIDGSRLRQVEIVPDEEVPLLLMAQLADLELVVYYDEAISASLQTDLSAHVPEVKFPEIEPLLHILRSHKIQLDIGHFKTYVFPSQPAQGIGVMCLAKDDPGIKAFGFDSFSENVYAIQEDGAVISACVSARENARCGEAWVFTSPEYRHLGWAQKVVQAWAASLMEAGKVPFYSHIIGNTASTSLAAKLGLQPVFEEITIVLV